jgi:hypothetical protein
LLSSPHEKRRELRHYHLGRLAKVISREGVSHFCLVTDFSDGGVRINTAGFRIPDEFALYFSGDGRFKNGTYVVVWRNDPVVGAKLISASSWTFGFRRMFDEVKLLADHNFKSRAFECIVIAGILFVTLVLF